MNIGELEKRLRERESELAADIARTEQEARVAGGTGGQNGAAAAETKEDLLQQTTSDWGTFAQVRDALQRIAKGSFGRCVDCGRAIEDHRLDSVPWTPYCLEDQNRHDREAAEHLA